MPSPLEPASGALSRFRVIDLSRVRAGPSCARQLADWGADVITVEMPAALDEGDPHVGPRAGPDFTNLNRNTRSLTVNLQEPAGREIIERLVVDADVLLENFRPQVKTRLGLDYDTLAALNPRLVYASISGFGQDGPYRDRPGFDQIAQAMGGMMSVTGNPADGPMRAGIAVADLSAGLFCAYGILVALLEREVSGAGQWVQTSLLQAQAFMLDFQAARWLMASEVPVQDGNFHATIAPCGRFRAADGYLSLAVVGDTLWQRFCHAAERAEWLERAEWSHNAGRLAGRDDLHAAVESVLGERPRSEWVERFNTAGVPCGPINAIDELFDDPQVRHLGLVQSLERSDGSAIDYLGQPVTLSRTPSRVSRHTPSLGEHTDALLNELGYDAAQVAALRKRGII